MSTDGLAGSLATKHLSFAQIDEERQHFSQKLMSRPELRHRFSSVAPWHLAAPASPGVYAIFLDDQLVYVGETGNLRSRMRDLRETRTHTVRRAIGKNLGFIQLHTDQFDIDCEIALNSHMDSKVQVRWEIVWFGRKEVEEFMIESHKPRFCVKRRRR